MHDMPRSKSERDCPQNEENLKGEQLRAALAEIIRERSGAAFLYGSLSRTVGESVGPEAFQAYRDQLLADAGSPHDPIEIMLIEATALAFANVGRLHIKSANSDDYQVAATYAASATKLAAEFRRLCLALAEYRAKASSRLAVVHDNDDSTDAKHVA